MVLLLCVRDDALVIVGWQMTLHSSTKCARADCNQHVEKVVI